MADPAVSTSSLNPATAAALRSAHQRAAASTSSRASSRYSSAVATSSRGVNSTPRLHPRNGLGGARIDSVTPCPDLGGPRSLCVGVDLGPETLNQLASKSGPLLVGKPKGLGEQLSGIRRVNITTAFLSAFVGSDQLVSREAPAEFLNVTFQAA